MDKVILVDSNNKYLAKMDKLEAHQHPAKLHQAVSVWLINDKMQVLLQKRSSKKIVGAGWWANAVCGNVRPTEIYSDCANRRLKEEINAENLAISPVYRFVYQAYCNEKYGEHESDQVYVGKFNGDVVPNMDEVDEVAWVDLDDLIKQISVGALVVSPNQTLIMNLEELKKNTAPCKVVINGKEELLAPWTCMMLKDARLIDALKNTPSTV